MRVNVYPNNTSGIRSAGVCLSPVPKLSERRGTRTCHWVHYAVHMFPNVPGCCECSVQAGTCVPVNNDVFPNVPDIQNVVGCRGTCVPAYSCTSTTVLSRPDVCAKCVFCEKRVGVVCMLRFFWFWRFLMVQRRLRVLHVVQFTH